MQIPRSDTSAVGRGSRVEGGEPSTLDPRRPAGVGDPSSGFVIKRAPNSSKFKFSQKNCPEPGHSGHGGVSHTAILFPHCRRLSRWLAGCYLSPSRDMFLLRALVVWVGCGLVSLVAERLLASDEAQSIPHNSTPAPRANRNVTLQFVAPQLEMTSLSSKGTPI